jgi:hypothetical protein
VKENLDLYIYFISSALYEFQAISYFYAMQATQGKMKGKQGHDKSTLLQTPIAKHDSTECSLNHKKSSWWA